MIFIKIFTFRKLYKEFSEDPSKASGEELVDVLRGIILIPKIIGFIILALLFIFGFTHLITEQLTACKVLFLLLLPIYLLFIIISKIVLHIIHTKVESFAHKIIDR